MKAAGRLVLMYLLLAGCLGLFSLYVGCTRAHQNPKPAAVTVRGDTAPPPTPSLGAIEK